MTRRNYYSVVMPIAALVYVALGFIFGGLVWTVGAICLAIIAVAGRAIAQP